ncbi:MAG: hypothetical protein AB7I42_24130 [Bradyrhizobium sp.]|uniref:hypothetical protein n=1 Tax=Bradyrhizobium sp. TaxID=376 RepID=UPI003D14189F
MRYTVGRLVVFSDGAGGELDVIEILDPAGGVIAYALDTGLASGICAALNAAAIIQGVAQ